MPSDKENSLYYIKCVIRSIAYKNHQFVISVKPTKEYRFSDESVLSQRDEICLAYKDENVVTIKKEQLKNIIIEEKLEKVIGEMFVKQRIVTLGLFQENEQTFRLVEMRVG